MEGLVVRARRVPVGTRLRLDRLTERIKDVRDSGALTEDGEAAFHELLDELAGGILSWNLQDEDDEDVPATREGLLAQDLPFVMAIVRAWTMAGSGVAPPLPDDSNSGPLFPVESIPMDTLSPGPVS